MIGSGTGHLGTSRIRCSLLKNPFAPSSTPGSGTEYGVFVVFQPCFRALLDHRPGRRLLFQQAGWFKRLIRPTAPMSTRSSRLDGKEGSERDLTDPQSTLARRARMMATATPRGQALRTASLVRNRGSSPLLAIRRITRRTSSFTHSRKFVPKTRRSCSNLSRSGAAKATAPPTAPCPPR
jgi:hypothetical protein